MQKQSNFFSTDVKNPRRSISITGQLHTNGYGVGVQYEKMKRKHNTTVSFFLSEIKSDKEEKFQPANLEVKPFGKPKPYIYGKENSLYNLNLVMGRRTKLIEGLVSPSIDISVHYFGGLAIALLKPYALKLKYVQPDNKIDIREETHSLNNHDLFLDQSIIYGRANFGHSFSDITIAPGFIGGVAVEAEVGKHPTFVKRIQVGGQLLAYTNKMNLLVREDSKAFYYSAVVGLSIGKRW